MVEREIRLYADYSQFYIQDGVQPPGATADDTFWTTEASDRRLAVGETVLGIGTGSYAFVKVRVEEHQKKPSLDLAQWDHVTEASLKVQSGLLLIFGCLSSSGLFFEVEPKQYRVRACHANLAESEQDVPPDWTGEYRDWYLVQFWPAASKPPQVLKRWRGAFADQHIAELGDKLGKLLKKELSAGNEVVRTYKHEGRILVMLRLPFRTWPGVLPSGLTYHQGRDPRCPRRVEYVDEKTGHSLGYQSGE